MSHLAVFCICAVSLGGVMMRPRGLPEWIWALGGGVALVLLRLVSPDEAMRAVARGSDVYAFLLGMMLLAELARREGVFDYVAGRALTASRGSPTRLFTLVYGVGILVTIVLSNDATAVVLTPAVAAVLRQAEVAPLPYLYACAFIANAASFVLPISNPANLVVFAGAVPPLGPWLAAFALPSLLAVAATYGALRWISRADLRGTAASPVSPTALSRGGRTTLYGIAVAAVVLVAASAFSLPLGLVTLVCGATVFMVVVSLDRSALAAPRSIAWGVLALVAGLFILAQAVEATGLLVDARAAAVATRSWSPCGAAYVAALASALTANLANNLPAGLIAGAALPHDVGSAALRNATAVGIDLGPNLSVTGSLATVLWLIALRREGLHVGGLAFLRAGLVVMPPALLLAVGALCIAAPAAK